MKTDQTPEQITRKLLAYAIVNDQEDLIKLLQRNGVSINGNPSTAQLQNMVTTALSKSKIFEKELINLLSKNYGDQFSSVDGDTTTEPKLSWWDKTKSNLSNFTSGVKLDTLLNSGLTVWSTSSNNKTQKAIADKQLELERIRLEQVQAAVAGAGKNNSNTPTGTNTALYVSMGVICLVLVAGTVFWVTRKK